MPKIAIKFGLILALGLVSFFLVMHFLNLSQNYNLRLFNGIIHVSVIYFAMKEGLKTGVISGTNYISGVFLGMFSSFIGVALFAFFQMLFLKFNPDFLAAIQGSTNLGDSLNPFTASLIILVEGVAVSLTAAYLIARILEINKTGELH